LRATDEGRCLESIDLLELPSYILFSFEGKDRTE
jgi:hypothetical protein